MKWHPSRGPTAESFWRAIDRLSSVVTLLACMALVTGLALAIRDGRSVSADAVEGPIDQESIAGYQLATLGRIVKGHPSASLAMIEFSDFECPYCARYATGTHARLEREYVDTGKVRYAFRHLPLSRLHPHAQQAAQAAECAARQARFWDMYDRLFANQQKLATADLTGHAGAVGLDRRGFTACLDTTAAAVAEDVAEAERLGITSTPTFLIGIPTSGSELRILRRVKGAYPPSVFAAILDELQEQATR